MQSIGLPLDLRSAAYPWCEILRIGADRCTVRRSRKERTSEAYDPTPQGHQTNRWFKGAQAGSENAARRRETAARRGYRRL